VRPPRRGRRARRRADRRVQGADRKPGDDAGVGTMLEELFKTVSDQSPKFAIVLLILYSFFLTCFALYKLIASIYFEAKKDYLTKLSSYCESVSDIVARIAIADDYPSNLIKEFWAYYFGKLILVEDFPLEAAMVDLGKVLKNTNKDNFDKKRKKLEKGALAVSGACRDLMKMTWKLSISPWSDFRARQRV
jgi:hypothetical protein